MHDSFPRAAHRYQSFRDWVWSHAGNVNSGPVVREEGRANESELEIQARWFGGEFGRQFTGEDGEKIEMVQFGHWNRGAGPDFTEAAVRINGKVEAGSVELDLDARDWEAHGHGANPEFEDTVLHVYTDGPALARTFTRTREHRKVCQLQLPQYSWSQGPPDFLPEAFPGRCVAPLGRLGDEEVRSLLVSAAQYRLKQKASRLAVMSTSTSPEQALFQAVAEALGYRQNQTAMAVLAQRCSVKKLKQLEPFEREARLFGAAGFLDREIFDKASEPGARDYLRTLWEYWWKIRDQVEPSPKRAIPWKFSGSRPANHPQRRIGALSSLLNRWGELAVFWNEPEGEVEKFVNNSLNNLSHNFWNRHYTLRSRAANSSLQLLGKDRLRDILGNVIFPGVIGAKADLWNEFLALRGVATNQKLRRASLRLFGADLQRQKLFTSYYHQQQGLLQIYRDFCLEDLSECSHCPFPEQLTQWQGMPVPREAE